MAYRLLLLSVQTTVNDRTDICTILYQGVE